MGDIFSNLGLGFGVVFQFVQWTPAFLGGASIPIPVNILLCLIGALVGTLVGVLPGIGTIATVAMLLPITFGLPPVGALIMLAGIYYGAQYGGSTTSILVNIPGEAGSVVTALDGFQMAKQGRAGPALAIAAIGSFFAGCVATVLIAVLGAPLTKLALAFGPAEYFSLMVLGLIFAAMASFVIAACGTPETRWVETLIVGACLTAFCSLLFPYALGLPLQLLPTFLIR
jgi:putative tricarboxylic transport membrane protein